MEMCKEQPIDLWKRLFDLYQTLGYAATAVEE